MKKKASVKAVRVDEDETMRPEYDFSTGTRGKHYKSRLDGYAVRIHKEDGTTEVRQVTREGSVVLEPDVQKYFPNSQAVDRALRALITLFPRERKGGSTPAVRSDQTEQ